MPDSDIDWVGQTQVQLRMALRNHLLYVMYHTHFNLDMRNSQMKGVISDTKMTLFNYGYVGNYDVSWVPTAGITTDTTDPRRVVLIPGVEIFGVHTGFNQQFNNYTPASGINEALANYNNTIEGAEDITDFYAYNGFVSDNFNTLYSGLHDNVGSTYNSYRNKG